MVTRTKTAPKRTTRKRGGVKVGKLKLNKETVKDLSASQQKQVKGGRRAATWTGNACGNSEGLCD